MPFAHRCQQKNGSYTLRSGKKASGNTEQQIYEQHHRAEEITERQKQREPSPTFHQVLAYQMVYIKKMITAKQTVCIKQTITAKQTVHIK
jgi:hypothetical protein